MQSIPSTKTIGPCTLLQGRFHNDAGGEKRKPQKSPTFPFLPSLFPSPILTFAKRGRGWIPDAKQRSQRFALFAADDGVHCSSMEYYISRLSLCSAQHGQYLADLGYKNPTLDSSDIHVVYQVSFNISFDQEKNCSS